MSGVTLSTSGFDTISRCFRGSWICNVSWSTSVLTSAALLLPLPLINQPVANKKLLLLKRPNKQVKDINEIYTGHGGVVWLVVWTFSLAVDMQIYEIY